jgi:phenylacetate-CoA ligase
MRITICGDATMTLIRYFVHHVGYRLYLAYQGESGILGNYRKSLPLWTADREVLALQRLNDLKAMLIHAGATSPYYRDVFQRVGFDPNAVTSLLDLAKLPFIRKDDLSSEMPRILSNQFQKDELVAYTTGGSSGLTLTFYRDNRTTEIRRAQDLLFSAKIGVYPGTKRAWVWGAPLDAWRQQSFKSRIRNLLSERAIFFHSYEASAKNIEAFLQRLNKHRPEVILAYPNMLAVLAEYARDHNIPLHPVPKVVVTAEAVYDWQRGLFKEVFGATTYERYGAREMGTLAAEVNCHRGLHIFEPSYIIEVVDQNGLAVVPGEMGELVITDLCNHAMPLIRYRTGDMVALDESLCGCGCTWRRISKVTGRILDLVTRADGSRVAGQMILDIVRDVKLKCRIQVRQTSVNNFIIRHLETDNISNDIRNRISESFKTYLGAGITVEYEKVKELTYDKSGKYRWFINELNKRRSVNT